MNEIELLKTTQRQIAAMAIERAIDDPGQLDDWRKSELSEAIDRLDCGLYWWAEFQAKKALLSLGEGVPFVADEQIRRLTRDSLRNHLHEVLGQPVRLRAIRIVH